VGATNISVMACFSALEGNLGDFEFSESNSESVDFRAAGFAAEPQQLFLCCLCCTFQFREFLSAISVLPSVLPSCSVGHRPFLALLVD